MKKSQRMESKDEQGSNLGTISEDTVQTVQQAVEHSPTASTRQRVVTEFS